MNWGIRGLVVVGLVLVGLAWPGAPAWGAGDPCGALSADERAQAERVMASVHPHECCDGTLAACLAQPRPVRLVRRLAGDVCRRVAAGQDDETIRRGLERRGESMLAGGDQARIDRKGLELAGDATAPVEVVVYSCARCPFCSKIVPALHTCVTEGRLKGVARLAMRVFPIRSHPLSVEGGLAFAAAERLGRFWDYVLRVYERYDDFRVDALQGWAVELGLDGAAFEAALADPALRERLVAAKREGISNRVDATPTFFLNGRRYRGDLDPEALWDAIEEEAERVQGTLCEPAP